MKNVTDIKQKILEKVSREEAEKAIRTILKFVGENPDREGLLETPQKSCEGIPRVFFWLFN